MWSTRRSSEREPAVSFSVKKERHPPSPRLRRTGRGLPPVAELTVLRIDTLEFRRDSQGSESSGCLATFAGGRLGVGASERQPSPVRASGIPGPASDCRWSSTFGYSQRDFEQYIQAGRMEVKP